MHVRLLQTTADEAKILAAITVRAWSVPWISKTHARQNETLRICKIHTGRVFGPSVGQFRGNSLGGLGLRHAFVTLVRNLEDTQLYIFRVKAEL